MDEPDAHIIPPSLKSAVRKARVEQAERSDVVSDLRRAELARLELLHDAFKPILAQVPASVDLFDCGIAPGERPRLFVDMIAFVEMGHDKRTYRFVQDTRHGRMTLAEGDRVDPIVESMTDYIARRLVEREAALAADITSAYAQKEVANRPAFESARVAPGLVAPGAAPDNAGHAAPPTKRRWRRLAESALLFTIELLGSIVLFIILIGAIYFAWRFGENLWISRYAQLR
ncbi:MAG: hypothetical protein Q8M31_05890 [Beijerinckiaceae bacterium]|nr:hypothetical protein [Beijerinckiaceae bacterium]